MTKIAFYENGFLCLDAISKEEDLDPKRCGNVNPPPSDGRCNICGRHISELKPFGGPGDPLVGDFTGELLVKTFRGCRPHDLEAEKAWEEAHKALEEGKEGQDFLPWFIASYGEEKGESFYEYGVRGITYSMSWECRDCIVLDEDEYFEKLEQRYREHRNK